jgi:hypothetical protein
MGIQIKFDTDGITSGNVKDPTGRKIYSFVSAHGMKSTGGQTEGFLEGVEPQITELLSALGCEPSNEEGQMSLDDLFAAWPAGDYAFKGINKGRNLRIEQRSRIRFPLDLRSLRPRTRQSFR